MKIAIRLDDITPDMDWEKFLIFKELLTLYNIKPLIGVVPENKDNNLIREEKKADFWSYVKELQKEGWSIAMHGYQHIYDTNQGGMFPLNHFSEFAGHSLEIQKKKIKTGKALLEEKGIYTDIFMAPAHSYDKNTLTALKENGFCKITDGFGSKPYIWQGMTFYPISFRMSDSLKKENGYTTMVVHTNTIDNMDYYKNILEKYQDKFISYSQYLSVVPEPRNGFDMKKEFLGANVKHFLVKLTTK